jgi:hypothetical protein
MEHVGPPRRVEAPTQVLAATTFCAPLHSQQAQAKRAQAQANQTKRAQPGSLGVLKSSLVLANGLRRK